MTLAIALVASALADSGPAPTSNVYTNTADIRELLWDGEVLWAATGGGLEAWSADGQLLATVNEGLPGTSLTSVGLHLGQLTLGFELQGAVAWDGEGWETVLAPGENLDGTVVATLPEQLALRGDAPGLVSDAVVFQGQTVLGTLHGQLHVGEQVIELGCPITDLSADVDQLRVACMFTSWTMDERGLVEVGLPATAAHPGAWGLRDGKVLTEEGVAASVPGRITSLARLPEGWAVGTEAGLYLVDDHGHRRLTPEGQICGNFITGAATFRGELLVTTFEDGACRFDGQRWWDIEHMPSALMNDVVVHEDEAWFATSAGLVRWDGQVIEEHHPSGWRVPRGQPGLNHDSVTALASGSGRLWVSDVLGPVSMAEGEYWRRHRLSVFGTSYQAVAACGEQAWVASEDAGVSHWTGRSWRHHDGTSGLPDDWAMAVACEGQQAWAGTYRDGVWRWDGRSWTEIPGVDPWILSVAKAPEALYVGTMDGLYRLGEEVQRLEAPDPRVHQISVEEGLLLVGTEGGLLVRAR